MVRRAILSLLFYGAEMPTWFGEGLKIIGLSPLAFIFGRMSRQDVSESKLATVLKTVEDMGEAVSLMSQASNARQEQIANLQRQVIALQDEKAKLESQIQLLSRDFYELRGQINGARR